MSNSPTVATLSQEYFDPNIPQILPHEKMYKIQVGKSLFKISGASLSSDGPSFFTEYFSKKRSPSNNDDSNNDTMESNKNEVLFIDRSAEVFEWIYQHLQGYIIEIKDEVQYTMLFADAMYYNLPRLRSLLKETDYYFTNIGGQSFKIAKNLFRREGDSPNYFEIYAATVYIDVEELIISKKLLRPPPHSAPYVPRSSEYFKDLLTLLGGASIDLDDNKRNALIKECRYYRLLNLEQRLIKSHISYNPITRKEEICLLLKDLSKKGITFPASSAFSTSPYFEDDFCSINECDSLSKTREQPANKKVKLDMTEKYNDSWNMLCYKRPFLDKHPRELIFQINSTDCTIILNKESQSIHVDITGESAYKFEALFGSHLPNTPSGAPKLKNYQYRFPSDSTQTKIETHYLLPACIYLCDLDINGIKISQVQTLLTDKNKFNDRVIDVSDPLDLKFCSGLKLYLRKSLWKLAVKDGNIMLIAIKAIAFNGTKEYYKGYEYL
ncbi:BAH_G0009670.mRNA.1.CDS.1 [Saccharomyces cerevisiae]|nr:SX2_G0044850.mRNA.1.CDS.1 [Saccharomyces cerevisiae]CAI4335682.1 BAH_G0009670.mRNA.1.CDS.1 [Saccharomyces cerevisiae]CAI4336439.1 BAG_1a_G0009810.mRNA.1.CDS.1 [Saccharomyces cerevisiae]CAI7071817.1 BAH_G0009670.mRNA.1.CDS.1 [Saccharomyces cerevisiae]CAI7072370.1 BAG_1a_G0009810.mRNA.1.CDS.1 [Saccharomyces cerevisiae]